MHDDKNEEKLLGYKEAAQVLGVKLGTLYAWVHAGRVPHVRLGPRCVRFEQRALRRFIRAHRVGAPE